MDIKKADIFKAVFAIVILLITTSCVTDIKVEIPPGFASEPASNNITVYSADGYKFSVKAEKNKPQQSTEFWAEALKTNLLKNGYLLIEESDFLTENLSGKKFLWLMPVEHDYYKYMTAISVKGKVIYVIEAAAEKSLYDSYADETEKMLSSITVPE